MLTNHHEMNKDLNIDIASVMTPAWITPHRQQQNWDKRVWNIAGILAESGARPYQSWYQSGTSYHHATHDLLIIKSNDTEPF